MITQLRERDRADRFLNDVRANQKKRRNYGRYVYLAGVFTLFLSLANLFVGSYFWLKAEGLVVSDHVVIASPYEVQVVRMVAQPGQWVKKGDVLAEVHSPQVSQTMADLTVRTAETTARQAELAIKLEVANTVLESAEERLVDVEAQLAKVNSSHAKTGSVSDAFIASVQKDRYTAIQEKAWRQAEGRAAEKQLGQLQKIQEEARLALKELSETFNGGVIRAPSDGIVGPQIMVQGEVIQPGDHLMQLYVGSKYALVYLETGTLYEVKVGDRVEVADGFKVTDGTVSEVLPLTVPLPTEFQKAFRPPSRGQVVRIALATSAMFPIFSKVSVTGDKLIPGNDDITRSKLFAKFGEVLRAVYGGVEGYVLAAFGQARAFASPQ